MAAMALPRHCCRLLLSGPLTRSTRPPPSAAIAAVHDPARSYSRIARIVRAAALPRWTFPIQCVGVSLPIPRRTYCSTTAPTEGTRVARVAHVDEKHMVKVEWQCGASSQFSWLWLRDNCQCQDCFHPVSLSRTFFLSDLDLNIRPQHTQVTADGSGVRITWTDGHESQHGAAWLRSRAFEPQQRATRDLVNRLPYKPWPATLPSVSWQSLMKEDVSLLQWLEQLETYGLVLVHGAPQQPGVVGQLARRVAFIKRTHYGEEFSVIAKPEPSNVAYSNAPLALHLDLPYYFYKPGVQLIHCVIQHQGEGGDSQVSDAVQVAEHLRQVAPHMFDLLASTPVDWVDMATEDGRDYFKTLKIPLICLEKDGRSIWRINFSQPQRDSYFTECPPERVHDWYQALKTFHDLLYHPRFLRTFKMEPGTIMCLDNLRVTHGRTGYPSSEGPVTRHIEGCYLDWDEVRSKRRVLQRAAGDNLQQ